MCDSFFETVYTDMAVTSSMLSWSHPNKVFSLIFPWFGCASAGPLMLVIWTTDVELMLSCRAHPAMCFHPVHIICLVVITSHHTNCLHVSLVPLSCGHHLYNIITITIQVCCSSQCNRFLSPISTYFSIPDPYLSTLLTGTWTQQSYCPTAGSAFFAVHLAMWPPDFFLLPRSTR